MVPIVLNNPDLIFRLITNSLVKSSLFCHLIKVEVSVNGSALRSDGGANVYLGSAGLVTSNFVQLITVSNIKDTGARQDGGELVLEVK